ncbi:PHP domain-containing protein [Nitratidesulfovibrio sp. 1201_IL3209]|uniref:PHP domain-containing protein n=1 Tax=Nitratidesulfovibrio sp. 1201_IL3209 TaxID=3084053 RepID=UPI002FDA0464
MSIRFIDLHSHSTASDGSDTPAELVRKAAAAKLAAIALTDHDTTSGLDEAVREGRQRGIEVIRGCELGVRCEHGELHILGLWLPEGDGTHPGGTPLEATLAELREHRAARNRRIAAQLRQCGVDIEYAEVEAISGGESVSRLHFARILHQKGYVPTPQEAFARYIGPGGRAYVAKETLSPADGVALLHSVGATVALAHPMLFRYPGNGFAEWLDDTVADLKRHGLDAIEAYHSEHSQADTRRCVDLAARHGLALTGGSDYHGAGKPGIALGRGRGGLRVTTAVLDDLKERRRRQGLPV